MEVLAEIKVLLENYAETNGKYEKYTALEDFNSHSYKEPEMDLMSLLCLPPDDKTKKEEAYSTTKKVESLKHVHKIGKTIAQTGRNLRTIIMKPKRLVWAAVDKDSFECLISKIENLVSFLIALLDSSQIRRLQDNMNTTYLEILQLRNDVGSLAALIKALTPATQNSLQRDIGPENNPMSRAVAEETADQQKRKKYLKQLVEIKIQFTLLNQLNSKDMFASDSNKFVGNPLPLGEFVFAERTLEYDTLQRTSATYQGTSVWIEWKDILAGNDSGLDNELVENRIGLLTDLLCSVKPDGFRAPPCLGYVKVIEGDHATRFGVVFEKPSIGGLPSKIITLRELLTQRPKPSLSKRVSLCAVLARCVHSFHAVNWLHKALRSDNIIFFVSSEPPNLSIPYVSGFELSRPSIIDQMTERPRFDPFKDIYRHPNTQSSQSAGNYNKSYDIYSLGILIIEIALWMRIEDIVGFENLSKAKPSALQEMQSWVLGRPQIGTAAPPPTPTDAEPCLQQVASACGDTFRNIVEHCLEADNIERTRYSEEQETVVALRLQMITENDVVQKLEYIAGAL